MPMGRPHVARPRSCMALPQPVLQGQVEVVAPYVPPVHGSSHRGSASLGERQERRAEHDAGGVRRVRAAVSWLPREPDEVTTAGTVCSRDIPHDIAQRLTDVAKPVSWSARWNNVVHSLSTSLSSTRRLARGFCMGTATRPSCTFSSSTDFTRVLWQGLHVVAGREAEVLLKDEEQRVHLPPRVVHPRERHILPGNLCAGHARLMAPREYLHRTRNAYYEYVRSRCMDAYRGIHRAAHCRSVCPSTNATPQTSAPPPGEPQLRGRSR